MLTNEQFDTWVAALRSGKYKKGYGALCQTRRWPFRDCYCALGVLADTLNLFRKEQFDDLKVIGENTSAWSLPDKYMAIEDQKHIMFLNDSHNKSFKEIADELVDTRGHYAK